ncbi:hypothetical protein CDEST_01095 [Colletotrichum destructivum]|uniref:Uncharacterized protein n=1 Tax=Colletotrichum destructivum TaxID=34406 RepID=A0AAX4HYW6_9PEZI|nr:hypothetical protein CDEST_01095 [Colletotrichum destructivum]
MIGADSLQARSGWLMSKTHTIPQPASISWAMSPEKPHPKPKTLREKDTLAVVKTGLESLRALIKASAASIAQYSARNHNYKLLPRPLSLEDTAASRLTIGPDKTSVLSGTDEMFRTFADKFYDLFAGPVSRHVDVLIQRVDSVVSDEEADEEDEEGGEKDAMAADRGIDPDEE